MAVARIGWKRAISLLDLVRLYKLCQTRHTGCRSWWCLRDSLPMEVTTKVSQILESLDVFFSLEWEHTAIQQHRTQARGIKLVREVRRRELDTSAGDRNDYGWTAADFAKEVKPSLNSASVRC